MLAMLRARPTPEWEREHIGSWFTRTGQTARAVERFWTPILVSACNDSLDRISVTHAFKVFRDGFLASATSFHFGVPRVPLGTLYTEPTVAFLKARGGCVETRVTVDRLTVVPGRRDRMEGIFLQDGEMIAADYYVSALQFDLLLKLLPPEIVAGEDYFEALRDMHFSPIVGVHFWFDRPIECPEALALLDRRSDWIFHKNRNFDQPDDGSYLSVVISADAELTAMPKDRIEEIVLEEVRQALPQSRTAKVVKSYVLKERKATFSPSPGFEALRPDQKSPISNLFVAGEWTRTGWPSTMESAAKSGFLAAERILEAEGLSRAIAVDDLPPSGLCRWLLRR
jgi:zeta-carotene desaturase